MGNEKTVGGFGEQKLNDNGERLIDLWEQNALKITKGFFEHKAYTNIVGHRKQEVGHRKQRTKWGRYFVIYCVIISNNTTITIKDVRVQWGTDCGTGHTTIAKIKFAWKGTKTSTKIEEK